MLVKNDVLSEFKNVRSYERVDLLCSLLDLCLPYELRFLGTCLEFLGKRDFYELREDERDANNVNHVTSFRSLMDENTRRKLVLYVSLLKSCNSDCANCLNETLTTLCISDVSQMCRSQPENGEKVLDELLLLYTIAVKHPAFNVHQKTEFAEHLRSLQEEDHKLSLILNSSEDGAKASRPSKPADSIPETPCKFKDITSVSSENMDSSSQISVISLANPLTCHVLSGSVYTSAVLPSALHQASATCLNPSHVMVSSVSSPVVQPTADGHPPDSSSRLNTDTVIAVGLTASPVNPSLMMGPGSGPGPGPGPGMVVPLAPPSSHCMMSSSGEMGVQKGTLGHPNVMGPMMCVPPESIPMPYPGHGHYSMGMMMPVPLVGHMPGPPLGCPPSSMGPVMNTPGAPMTHTSANKPVTPPVSAPGSNSTPKTAPTSCSSYSHPTPNPAVSSSSPYISGTGGSTLKENSNKYEECERQSSRPSSPLPKVPTPPSVSKAQVFNSKGLSHPPQHVHQHQQPYRGQPNHSSHMPYQIPPNMFPSTQQFPPPLTHLSPKLNSSVINHVPHYQNQIISIGTAPFPPQGPQHVIGQWHGPAPGDNLKDVIVREMPKYKANLQDLSPEELLHMGDEQLKEIGLPYNAIQQLRSIMNKLHSTNGINCLNRNDALCHNENFGPRRRHYYPSDSKPVVHSQQGPHATVSYGYAVPSSYSGNTYNSTSNGGSFNKGGKRQHLQITNQVRALQLEDESKRPASNSSSTSDCSSGSHSPPETPSLPLISEVPPDHFEKGYSGKDSGAESWNSATSDDKNKEERLQEGERLSDDRTRLPSYQPPGIQRNSVNSRSRGMSKAPPGIPTMPRGRGHPMAEKNRHDPVAVGSMNGVPSEMNNPPPPPYAISGTSGMPSNVPYPNTPVSSFIPHTPFTTMHAFHRFQSGSFLPAGTAYPFPPNGEMWSPFHQPPQPTPPYLAGPIVAFSPAHPPPKLSCYNCGRQGHQGSDCKESTFEEITQQGQYHLDYKPGDCRDSDK